MTIETFSQHVPVYHWTTSTDPGRDQIRVQHPRTGSQRYELQGSQYQLQRLLNEGWRIDQMIPVAAVRAIRRTLVQTRPKSSADRFAQIEDQIDALREQKRGENNPAPETEGRPDDP